MEQENAVSVYEQAGQKLAEAYQRFKTHFEDETGQDFDGVEPTEAEMQDARAFMSRIPVGAENCPDELRETLAADGARVSHIISNDSITWDGKGFDALHVQNARQALGMLTVDLRGADLSGANLSGTADLWKGADFSKLRKPF